MTDESPISLAEYEERQRASVRGATIRTALDGSPDDWAESVLIAKRKELPPQVVQRNLPELRTWTKADDINDLIGGGSKALQQKATDPDFMKLAVDDVPTLVQLTSEELPKLTKDYGFAQAAKEQRAKRDNAWARMAGDAHGDRFMASDSTEFSKGDNLSIDWRIGLNTLKSTYHGLQVANLMDFQSDPEAMHAAEQHMQAIADIQKENSGLQSIMRDSTQQFFASSNEADVWDKLSALGTALSKDPIGVSTDLFVQSGPASLAMLTAAMLARFGGGNMASIGTAGGMASTVVETGNRYISNLQNGQAHDDAWNDAVVSGGAVGIFDALSIGSAGEAVGAIAKQPLVQRLVTAAKEVGVQAAFGAGGEAWSGIVVNKQADPAEMVAEALGEVFGSGFEGIAAAPKGALQAIFQGARNGQGRLDDIQESMRQVEALSGLFNFAAQSALRQRSPEHFADLLQQASGEYGAPSHIYIDGKALAGVLQQAGMDPAAMPSVAEALEEAVQLNNDVAIPLGEATAAFSGSGLEQTILPLVKFEAGGQSLQESQQVLEQSTTILREEADKAIAKQANVDAWTQSSQAVHDDILGQLSQANRFTGDVNGAYAALVRDYYTATAGRLGIMPTELYQQYPLKVMAQSPVDTGTIYNQSSIVDDQINQWAEGKLKSGAVLDLGPASEILQGFGAAKGPVHLKQSVLRKANTKHSIAPKDLHGITLSLHNPLAVFASKKGDGHLVVLTELRHDDGNIVAMLDLKATRAGMEINEISSLHPKQDEKIINWIDDGLLLGYEKTKGREWLEGSAASNSRQHQVTAALTNARIYESGAEYNQAPSAAFERWSHGNLFVDLDEPHEFKGGEAVVVKALHGTTADYTSIDLQYANIESDLGGGFYASNTREDVGNNYAGEGPDLTQKIQLEAERIADDTDREYDDPEVVAEAKAKFKANEGLTMPVFIRFDNPVVLGGNSETFLDYSEPYDEDTDEYGEPTGALVEIVDAIRNVAVDFSDVDAEQLIGDIFNKVSDNGEGISAQDLIDTVKNSEGAMYATDYERGAQASGEFARKVFEYAGYDGFIDQTVNNKFGGGRDYGTKMLGMDENTVHYIAFMSAQDQVKSALGNNGEFSDSNNLLNQDARGTFNPASMTTTLLKDADLSTFIHETGHFFLEMTSHLAADENAPAGIKQDMDTLLAWFGVPDHATWRGMTFEQRRPYHEQFARGFEAYAFEGKSPSLELNSVFQRFATWLRQVYRSLAEFMRANNVQLSNEVREVMDRMLASEQQIAMMKETQAFRPLFENAGQAGMTPEEWQQYQDLGVATSDTAEGQLERRSLRDMQWLSNAKSRTIKDLQKRAAGLRSLARIQARSEIMQQPVYMAWSFLTKPMDKVAKAPVAKPSKSVDPENDSLFVAIAKLGGINRDLAVSEWGVDLKDIPPPPVFGKPILRATDGLTVDGMAEALSQYGYLPVDEHGKWDLHDFEGKFFEELHSRPQFALQGEEARMKAEIEKRYGTEELQAAALAEWPAGRLDLEEAKGRYAKNVEDLRKFAHSDGLPIDSVAELFGFSSGDEMVNALLAADDPKQVIEARTDQIMLERHGDVSDEAAIKRAADEALHNEAHARFIATELSSLNKALGDRRTLTKAAQQVAAEVIGRRKIRDLRAVEFTRAEAKAAQAAEKALKTGDRNAAAQAKRDQLLNNAAAKAALEAQTDMEKALRYFNRFESDTIRKRVDPDYVDQIDALLERFDLRKGVSLKEIDKRKSLQEWMNSVVENVGIEPSIDPKLVNEANRKHYKDMTVEEMRGLLDAVRQIEHIGRLKSKLLLALDKREFNAAVDEAVDTIEANATSEVKDRIERNTKWDSIRDMGLEFFAMHRKFASLIREMDGNKDGGFLWQLFVRPMNERGDMEASMREKATVALDEIFKPIIKAGNLKTKMFIPSLGTSLSKEGRLMVALNWGNEANRQRVMDGDGWSTPQVDAILATLDEQDWQFVQKVWDYIDSFWPEIAAKERRITGSEPEKVEPTPVQTPFGELRGGYFPIMYDPMRSSKAENFADAEAAKQMMQGAVTRATTRRGHTKARVESVIGRPVRKDFGGISQHINQVVHDLAWHEWLIDTNRLLRNGKIDDSIRQHYGPEVTKMLKNAVRDIAAGEIGAQNAFERSINHLRTGATVAGLGFNLFTSLLQPLGLTQSMVRIGPKWVLKGVGQIISDPRRMNDKVESIRLKSEFMRLRGKTMQREINEVLNKVDNKYSPVEASFFWAIQAAQTLADVPTWIGQYEKSMAGGADEKSAIAMADQAVLDSQGGGQVKDLAAIQRGGPLLKLWTNFYSYFSVTYNLAVEQTKQTKFSDPMQVGALAVDYALLMVVPSVLQSLMRNALTGGDDDDDKLLKKIIQDEISYMLGMVIGLRELGSAFTGYSGYGGPAGLRFFAEISKLGKQIEQGEADMAAFKALNNTLGILLHYPAGQVNRTVEGIAAVSEGKVEGAAILPALVFGPPR